MQRSISIRRHRFSVTDYLQMGEVGILDDEDRVELIEGEILEMPPIGIPHSSVLTRVSHTFITLVGGRALVRIQLPLILGEDSAPQPDVAVVRYRADYYAQAHPVAQDVLLLVEVSHTTVRFDLVRKARLYARHGVEEYWVLDLRVGRLVVHREPADDGYRDVRVLVRGRSVTPLAFPDVAWPVEELLGPSD